MGESLNRGRDVSTRLERELVRLKAKVGLAGHLKVLWDPRNRSRSVHGEIIGSKIYIYDEDADEALHTLRHEFVEYVLTEEFLNPKIFEAKAHRRSDALVDIIARLIRNARAKNIGGEASF